MIISNNLKDKVRSISNDSSLNTSETVLVAKVVSANEKANICDIDMSLPSTGQVSTFKDIPVVFDKSSIIGWFPVIGEWVFVNAKHNSYKITGPYTSSYAASDRHYNDTEFNTLTSFYNYTIAGNLI